MFLGRCTWELQHQPRGGEEDVQPQLRPDGQRRQWRLQERRSGAGPQEQLRHRLGHQELHELYHRGWRGEVS